MFTAMSAITKLYRRRDDMVASNGTVGHMSVSVQSLPTPALIIDADALEHNLSTMSNALPAARLRPHVKAHKCTPLAGLQALHGHRTFTCATVREVLGLASAALGDDILLANEVLNPGRLHTLAAMQNDALITLAVDSDETVDAAIRAGLRNVVIDVNIGLPRCGVIPTGAGRLADRARRGGMTVRGVMGYEGHLMMVADRVEKKTKVDAAVDLLLAAHGDVGGDIVSSGGTGTFDLHDRVTEVQAGSYALMDSQYATLGHPFRQALFVTAQVIAVGAGWAVVDAGLKAFGMDHGNPSIHGMKVWFVSDEHITFSALDGFALPAIGDVVRLVPAHVDPTMAYHSELHIVRDDELLDTWAIDLRGW